MRKARIGLIKDWLMNKRPQTHDQSYQFWTLNRLFRASHDDRETGCRIWDGRLNKENGYGRIGYMSKQWRAHRLMYTLMLGDIPKGMELMHSCDNPRCINPNHLTPGTHAQNIAEAYAKGRKFVPQGDRHPRFSFTEEQARRIVSSDISASEIAAEFGVSKSSIYRLRNGSTWKTLDRSKSE